MSAGQRQLVLWVFGGVSAAGHLGLALASRGEVAFGEFIALQALLSIAFAAAAWVALRPLPLPRALPVIIGCAILFRVLALIGEPIFEDDHYRYLWDGRVAAEGIDPYFYAPDDPMLEDLRSETWSRIGYPSVPTIYPPLCQAVFRISHEIGGGTLLGLRLVIAAIELAALGLLVALLRACGRSPEWSILYAWNPLVIKELVNSSHIDALVVAALLGFLLLFVRGRTTLAAGALGAAVLSKLFPVVLLPTLVRVARPRHLALFLATIAVGYAVHLDAGELVAEGLFTYLRHWEFNDSLFVILHAPLRGFGDTGFQIAKGIAAILVLAVGLRHARAVREDRTAIVPATLHVLGALLLLGPVMDPWYLTWIAPLLCLVPSLPWLVLTQTAALSYAYWIDETDRAWIRPLEYGPFFLIAAAQAWPRVRARLAPPIPARHRSEGALP